jgi:hypothetical protein
MRKRIFKKLFVYASRFRAAFEDSVCFGWAISDVRFEWERLVSMKNREIGRLENLYTDRQSPSRGRARVGAETGSGQLHPELARLRTRHVFQQR